MEHNFKFISIFVDSKDTLYVQSASYSKKYGAISNGLITELHAPYTDEEIESTVNTAFDQYDSVPANEDLNYCYLAAHFGKKSYNSVVKDKRLVNVSWFLDKGFTIEPMKKVKRGHEGLPDYDISLGSDYEKGEFAQAVRKAIALSQI